MNSRGRDDTGPDSSTDAAPTTGYEGPMMMLVTFQFANGEENAAFTEELSALGNWSNRIGGAWLLETPLGPRKVRDMLGAKMNPGDRLFVARITQNWAGRGMGEGFPTWMERRKFE